MVNVYQESMIEHLTSEGVPSVHMVLLLYPSLPDGFLGKLSIENWKRIFYLSEPGSKVEKAAMERLCEHETTDGEILREMEYTVDTIKFGRKSAGTPLYRWALLFSHCVTIGADVRHEGRVSMIRKIEKIASLARFRTQRIFHQND